MKHIAILLILSLLTLTGCFQRSDESDQENNTNSGSNQISENIIQGEDTDADAEEDSGTGGSLSGAVSAQQQESEDAEMENDETQSASGISLEQQAMIDASSEEFEEELKEVMDAIFGDAQ